MSRTRIAIVEDDADIAFILSAAFTHSGGFEVVMFDDCETALFDLPDLRPGFILLDADTRSRMSAVVLHSYLEDSPFLHDVPVAFLTSRLMQHEVVVLERLAPVIPKPFDPVGLPWEIRAIQRRASRGGATGDPSNVYRKVS